MSVNTHAHEIPGGQNKLDEIARQFFSLPYTQLDDDQASTVWDEIERTEATR